MAYYFNTIMFYFISSDNVRNFVSFYAFLMCTFLNIQKDLLMIFIFLLLINLSILSDYKTEFFKLKDMNYTATN